MRHRHLALALFAAAACGPASSRDVATRGDAIVGGSADPGHPAVGGIDSLGVTYCSGSLIASRTFLTAGHCLPTIDGTDTVTFDVGGASLPFDVSDHVRHPKFSGEGKPFDVALFVLKAAPNIAPQPFVRRPLAAMVPGADLLHVGYGATEDTLLVGAGVKRQELSPITRLDSDFVYSGDAVHNTCNGDSGGPGLLAALPGGAEVMVSLVSGGPDCTSEGWDVRVDEVSDWIVATAQTWESALPADPLPPAPDAGVTTVVPDGGTTVPDGGAGGPGASNPPAGSAPSRCGCDAVDPSLVAFCAALALRLARRRPPKARSATAAR
jgi:hypothetical protein